MATCQQELFFLLVSLFSKLFLSLPIIFYTFSMIHAIMIYNSLNYSKLRFDYSILSANRTSNVAEYYGLRQRHHETLKQWLCPLEALDDWDLVTEEDRKKFELG